MWRKGCFTKGHTVNNGRKPWNRGTEIACLECGKMFLPLHRKRNDGKNPSRCCSKECHRKARKSGKIKVRYGGPFFKGMIGTNTGKKASLETRRKQSLAASKPKPWLRGRHPTEIQLGKMRSSRLGKYRGEKSPRWKGGVTPELKRIRQSDELAQWRKGVFARDNYTCQRCKQYNGYLEAHHLKNFSSNPSSRGLLINGITLCKSCHREFHNIYGIKENSVSQIKKFLLTTSVSGNVERRPVVGGETTV